MNGLPERTIAARVLEQAHDDWKRYSHIDTAPKWGEANSATYAAFVAAAENGYKTVREDIVAFLRSRAFLLYCALLGAEPNWMAAAIRGEIEAKPGQVVFFGGRGLRIG